MGRARRPPQANGWMSTPQDWIIYLLEVPNQGGFARNTTRQNSTHPKFSGAFLWIDYGTMRKTLKCFKHGHQSKCTAIPAIG